MTVVKIRIDAKNGVAELEGDQEFVATQLDKLLPLLERVEMASPEESQTDTATSDLEPASTATPPAASKRKKKGANPPKGTSCRARILILKTDGFFKAQRSPSDIVDGLRAKGWTHTVNQVGAALTMMFSKSEIQRTGADGSFKYYWDRG